MGNKIYNMCNIEKHISNFHQNYAKYKCCNSKRGKKRYYNKWVKISNQRKVFSEKSKDNLLQEQNDRYVQFIDLVRCYVELDSKLKAIEENIKMFLKK